MPRGQTDKLVVFLYVECSPDYGSAPVVVVLATRVIANVDAGIKPIFVTDSEWRTVQPHQPAWTMLFGRARDPGLAADSAVPGHTAIATDHRTGENVCIMSSRTWENVNLR